MRIAWAGFWLASLLAARPVRAAVDEAPPETEKERNPHSLELGLGLRSGFSELDDPGVIDGLRLAGRVPLRIAGLSVESSLYVRTSEATDTGFTRELVIVAHQGDAEASFQQPRTVERWSATVLLDWGFGERDVEKLPHAGPHAIAGLGLARTETSHATYNESASVGEPVVAMSAPVKHWRAPILVAGFAFDLYPLRHFGLRASWLARLNLEEKPDYDPEDDTPLGRHVANHGIFAIDLLARF